MRMHLRFVKVVVILLITVQIGAQDPFLRHFNTSKSYFNPALVGLSGSFSVNSKYRTSWNTPNTGFNTAFLSVEESVPCLPFDLGISMLQDNEGPAGFKTMEFAAMFAGKFAFTTKDFVHNIRIGLSPRFIYKSVDLSRLTFSDQLDPKYGLFNQQGTPNPTSFIPPNDGRSSKIFSPAAGLALWSLWGDGDQPMSSMLGFSLFHTISISDSFGHLESVLQLDQGAAIPMRSIYFLELEFITNSTDHSYMAINPLILYNRQSDLDYLEVGSSIHFFRDLSAGFYYHKSLGSLAQENADFYSIQANVGFFINEDQRADLGFSWSNTVTGLKNLLGPAFEMSFTYHFTKSFVCELAGRGNQVSYSSGPKCARFTDKHKYRYDNYTLHKSKRGR